MKYTRFLSLILFTILVSTFQIGAMHPLGRIFTKAFSKSITCLNWGISAGPMISYGIYCGYRNQLFGNELSIKTTEVSDNVKSFVQDTLHDNKVNVIKTDNQFTIARTTSKNIIVGKSTFIPSLEKVIKNKNQTANKKDLDIHRFILHHERNHQLANDFGRFFAAACIIPFITHYAVRLVGRKIVPYATKEFTKNWNKPKSTRGIRWFFLKELSKILTGAAKYVINVSLYKAYVRHREQKADDNVPEDTDILKGGVRFFGKAILHKQQRYLIQLPNQHQSNDSIFKQLYRLLYKRLLSSHPSYECRIEKLENRIKNLE